MTHERPSIEDQLRRYGDAIDPATASSRRSADRDASGRRPSARTAWLFAAAALVLLVAFAVGVRRDPAQQVDTGDFTQQSDDGRQEEPGAEPDTGDLRTREDSLVVMMAEQVLIEECMATQGFVHTMPTEQEWIDLFGAWRPHGILGIGAEGAARRIGYQSDGWGGAGSPSQSLAFNAMGEPMLSNYVDALTGRTIDGVAGGCWGVVAATLGDHKNRQSDFFQMLNFGRDSTQGERFRSDPVLADALVEWQNCIADATGIDADTPNTLAREFAFGSSNGNENELEVAVDDVRCQTASNLEEAFYVARTKQLRSELGDDVTVFDEYVRFQAETLELAQQVLDDRGVVPPALD